MSTTAAGRPEDGEMTDAQHFDPRMGDEEEGPPPTPRHVRIPDDIHDGHDGEKSSKNQNNVSPQPKLTFAAWVVKLFPLDLSWIPPSLTWSKFKPVIRCAVVCWVSALLMIIGPTSRMMGSVSSSVFVLLSLMLVYARRLAQIMRTRLPRSWLTLVTAYVRLVS